MSKLSDTQLVILTAACQRPDRLVLPLPARLKGGAADKVVANLTAKGLVVEVDARRGEPMWRETGDGHGVTLVATEAALAVLGIEPEIEATVAPTIAHDGAAAIAACTVAEAPKPAPARKTRPDSKQAQLVDMLKRPQGASVEELAAQFGWQPHTVRGAIAGALKKKLGLTVLSEKVEGRGRVYRIGLPALTAQG
jgi:hypothetical protein